MHFEVIEFIQRNAKTIRWDGAHVVEVGAYNVNGNARDYLPAEVGAPASWCGIDLLEGPGVDFVGDAAGILATMGGFDVCVSTEVLEHAPTWAALVDAMLAALKPHGYLLITCAGNGRAPHSADGSGSPHPGEYYRNVSLAEILEVIGARASVLVASELNPPGDTRLVARKAKGVR